MKLFLFVLLFPMFAFSTDLSGTTWTVYDVGCRDSSLSPLSQKPLSLSDNGGWGLSSTFGIIFIDDRNLKVRDSSVKGTYHFGTDNQGTFQLINTTPRISYIVFLEGDSLVLIEEDYFSHLCGEYNNHNFVYILRQASTNGGKR